MMLQEVCKFSSEICSICHPGWSVKLIKIGRHLSPLLEYYITVAQGVLGNTGDIIKVNLLWDKPDSRRAPIKCDVC
jgi:hypothetical protein